MALTRMKYLTRFIILLTAIVFLKWFISPLYDELSRKSVSQSPSFYSNSVHQEFHFKDFTSWHPWDNVTGFPYPIVPNIVHFIKFRKHEMSFVEMVVILAAWCHQTPDRLIIHCDCSDLLGPYWEKVKGLKGVEVRRIQEPREVFGKPLNNEFAVFHAGDIARIAVLQEFGGIVLDFDTYIVQSLDKFRYFECTVAWPEKENIGSQVIISHKNSRFIQLYSDSYHSYNKSIWYYNAGQLPTRILELMPHIVHRVPWKLGVHNLLNQLYTSSWNEWRFYYAIHLLARQPTASKILFDEHNIRTYPHTFGEMARLVLFGRVDIISDNRTIDYEYSRCGQ